MSKDTNRQVAAEQAGKRGSAAVGLVAGVVVLTLATAYIHSTLGGLLFTLNAVGYAALAAAIVVPIRLAAQLRWLIRLALLGFTLATIGGWVMFGARYDIAYLDKAIEVLLVAFLFVSVYRFDGGPSGVLARVRPLPAQVTGLVRHGH